ncbi:MAG: 3-deoxy-D-manno-octulosonate 8-phosphate phosphatase, YrbI family [Acidobacteria bacterium]|jgi:3-deoxy-D-manno-octulosonate 8-phosphate phosphatase (KDO 8-P phosphatase)|nr:3-deoxy-D-manno-octulosonate 8-phosphate phosphatase, YrbI family [Acidobacteriota bacterium]
MSKLILRKNILIRAKKVKLLLMDCDGVLTDGRLYFSEQGEHLKVFNVKDGQGLALWHKAGFRSGIISGRNAEEILKKRATEIGMHYIKACSLDKIRDFEDILKKEGLTAQEVAFVGDDIGDIGLMQKVGFPIAVADAVKEVKFNAVYKTKVNGGHGAIREVTDLLLKAKKSAV